MGWARKRKFWIAIGVIFVLAVLAGVPLYFYLDKPPTCTDGIQNQGEEDVDCGGPCTAACENQVEGLIIHWQRSFSVAPGIVDVVALIENPNPEAGLEEVIYLFSLYDEENILIAEKLGQTFVSPNEQFVVFEGGVQVGERVPDRAFFEFQPDQEWQRPTIPEEDLPRIAIQNQQLGETAAGRPRLTATLVNEQPFPVRDVEVAALLYDEDENVIAASATHIDQIDALGNETAFFTWREPFEQTPSRIDILPRVNPFTVE